MKKLYKSLLVFTGGAVLATAGSGQAISGTGPSGYQDLEEVVKSQQQQLDAQAGEIAALKEQLNALLGKTAKNEQALADKADKEEIQQLQLDKGVTSSNANVAVSLYGQVNRAGLWADNGDSSKVYFVDNEVSSTRMGLTAKARTSEDITAGGKIEYEVVSNSSNSVNQLQQNTDSSLNLRWADFTLESKRFGNLYLGHGSTASDSTTEIDLSGTGVAMMAKVQSTAGGQLWYDSATSNLTDLQVKNTITNIDGLSRRDRVRYDTPSFAGFKLAGSAVENGAFDAALKYSREFDGVKVAGALAWADPEDITPTVDYLVDGSISLLLHSGLSFTFAGGWEDMKEVNRDDVQFWYGKLGYKADLFQPGFSAFALDYGQYDNFALNNDDGQTLGLGYVQYVRDWATEFYLVYRLYKLDRDQSDFDDVNSILAGARIKF